MKLLKPKFWHKKNSFFSIVLLPLTFLVLVYLFFKKKIISKKEFRIPIICIGNIYVGGTGKTPLSIVIANKFIKQKKSVIIKKFYNDHRDEHRLINGNTKFLILNSNRIKAIEEAEKKGFELAVLDDGFQDLSIKKKINILCFNSSQPIGNAMVIPSGPLRDSFKTIKDAQIVVINGEKNEEFEKEVKKVSREIEIFYSKYIAKNTNEFKNKKLFAFAGIGNPENFFNLLRRSDLNLHKFLTYPDHYDFEEKEINKMVEFATKNNLELITTEKDFYRIKDLGFEGIKFLKIELKIFNEEKFFEKLKGLL